MFNLCILVGLEYIRPHYDIHFTLLEPFPFFKSCVTNGDLISFSFFFLSLNFHPLEHTSVKWECYFASFFTEKINVQFFQSHRMVKRERKEENFLLRLTINKIWNAKSCGRSKDKTNSSIISCKFSMKTSCFTLIGNDVDHSLINVFLFFLNSIKRFSLGREVKNW